MTDLPPSVSRFLGQLEILGFVRAADDTDAAAFGNRIIVLRRSPVEIRVIKDGGQWMVDTTADGWPDHERIDFPLFHGLALPDS